MSILCISERLQSLSSDSWSDFHTSPSEKSCEITNAELGLAEDHFSQPEVNLLSPVFRK